VKKKGIEFCWLCEENQTCEKWIKHKTFSKQHDSFVCYQRLEDNISFIQKKGIENFCYQQNIREKLLREMIDDFNEGRSKSYYCIAATVMKIEELENALSEAREKTNGLTLKAKAKILHSRLDEIAKKKNYYLKLRK
jgi:hypothetical protein